MQALGRRRADILEHGERSGWIAGYNMAVTSLAARHGREEAEEVLRRRIEEEDDCAEDEDISGCVVRAQACLPVLASELSC